MISIVNYERGNIAAVTSAYESLAIKFHVANRPRDLNQATHIVLPGVGSFDDAMASLANAGWQKKLNSLVLSDRVNILGICVGLQIMCKSSSEGSVQGFGWLDAHVDMLDFGGKNLKLPNMGWRSLELLKPCPVLSGVEAEEFYFLHSFHVKDTAGLYASAVSNYEVPITAAVSHENIYGVQFHPEKSHKQGLKILKNFSELKRYD